MQAHYFDIETYSPNERPDPETDTIITIQFQKFDLETGNPVGRLQVLKEWEDGEEEMLRFLHQWFFKRNLWNFIPVGFNLNFEWKFLAHKFKQYGIDTKEMGFYLENVPQIDLKVFAVLKKGTFFGASLSSISQKENDGHVIKEFYEEKNYDEIIKYVEQESISFLELYQKLKKNIDLIL